MTAKPKYIELFDLSEAKLREASDLLAKAESPGLPEAERRSAIERSEALMSEAEKLAQIAKQVARQ